MPRKKTQTTLNIFTNPSWHSESHRQVLQIFLKSPELRLLTDEEYGIIYPLIYKLDQEGLLTLKKLIDDRLDALSEEL